MAMSIAKRGVLAGLAGAAAMTVFQKLVEMPLTGREDSYASADLAERLLPVHPHSAAGRRGLNYAAHFALGVDAPRILAGSARRKLGHCCCGYCPLLLARWEGSVSMSVLRSR